MPTDQTTTPSSPNMPHSREAEEASVGAVLINPDAFHEVRQFIQTPDDFYIHRHRFIWKAYETLRERNTTIDLLTVANQLERMGLLEEVGGSAYLTALISQVPTSLNAAAYAAIVRENSVRRMMLASANKIASLAYDGEKQIKDLLAEMANTVSVTMNSGTITKPETLSEIILKVDEAIEERRNSGMKPGIPTGMIDLDKKLGGGAQDGDLLLVAGRPGQGKTSALIQFALHAAHYIVKNSHIDEGGNVQRYEYSVRKRVVIFSLEMPKEQIILRMLQQISGIDYQQLRSGNYPKEKTQDYINALDQLAQMDLVIDDTPGVTPAYIRSRCQILNAEQKIDIVFVDSLNLMKPNTDYKDRRDLALDAIAMDMKNLARELNVPVWLAHQMNRGIERRGKDDKPQLSDLAEGGERPADLVMFIWHKFDDIKKEIEASEFIIEKHRNGPIGIISVVFRQALTRFENAYSSSISFNR